jgi:hypothetical protein
MKRIFLLTLLAAALVFSYGGGPERLGANPASPAPSGNSAPQVASGPYTLTAWS